MTEVVTVGVIGGSGLYNLDGIQIVKEHNLETPFGKPSAPVVEASLGGASFFFLPRHGKDHQFLPHEVNYRANIYALKSLGVQNLVSVSAVGSLKEELPPTTMVMPDQFIDWTKGGRQRTFFGEGIVGHVSVANPIEKGLQDLLVEACQSADVSHSRGGSYICIEGPQFSTRAESEIYRSFGASVIGMTNVPESFLAKEAGMAYATIAMVTDYDCWKEEHCTVDEIMKVMATNGVAANKILNILIPLIHEKPFTFQKENTFAILTPDEKLTSTQKEILAVLKS
ncbi:MAG: S-methyl-5'-thioadenosine phosphorylase [Halobacteriovoraceae bacterium]|jgi:5'-methylthioadenosine phosphorylase|nr:S-methyl-5'-thioadenosine phosphorylase [Halobacteriovoraceae bacterium]MBT5095576.1 S-methyl-5'-thioadenosine phosphorylase [Halobacteriovoraceae bacterium]